MVSAEKEPHARDAKDANPPTRGTLRRGKGGPNFWLLMCEPEGLRLDGLRLNMNRLGNRYKGSRGVICDWPLHNHSSQ